MRVPLAAVVCACLFPAVLSLGAQAQSASALHLATRHKPGPVTIRGVAVDVRGSSFALQTKSHGTYQVTTVSATQVVEKGERGHLTVRSGDHVGVRGFVQGRQIRAIKVTIYPTKSKPKGYDVVGNITALQGSILSIATSTGTVRVQLTHSTTVRVGSGPGSTGQLRVGDKVKVHVEPLGHQLLALSIHVYSRKQSKKHIELRGTVAGVQSGAISVRAGSKTYTVAVTNSTTIYYGSARSSTAALKNGQSVTVYACCVGQPLTATSIHIRKTPAKVAHVFLKGRVVSLSAGEIRIAGSSGTATVALQRSTIYEVGSSPAGLKNVHVGDQVSVRAEQANGKLLAERVHVYVVQRRPRTFVATVVAVSRSELIVVERGKRYAITVAPATPVTLNGQRVSLSSIRAGDKVRVSAQPSGSAGWSATSVTAKRKILKPKVQSVHGTIAQVNGSSLVIVDDFGARHLVRLAPGVRARLHGKPAPAAALFPGVKAVARGRMSGSTLIATSLTLTVSSRTVEGRVTRVGGGRLTLRMRSGSTVIVDFPAGVTASDGSHRLNSSSVRVGAYLRVMGYVERSQALRAVTAQVLHLTVDFSGAIIASGRSVVVETSRGERYQLHFSSSSEISTGNEAITLKQTDIPVGARVHVYGTTQSDGSLAVSRIEVHLKASTVRGTVSAIAGSVLSVQTPAGTIKARSCPHTVYLQGSHALTLADIVVGDDVTVYGYADGPGLVLVRKLLVHRRLVGLTGSVASLTADGFTLTAADGAHRVIVTAATLVTGGSASDLQVGVQVHATGYLRGDGAVLATRLKLNAKRSA